MFIKTEKIEITSINFESFDEANNLVCAITAAVNCEEAVDFLRAENDFTQNDFDAVGRIAYDLNERING